MYFELICGLMLWLRFEGWCTGVLLFCIGLGSLAFRCMMSSGEAHDGEVGNPSNEQLRWATLPALELKMVRLVSVLEHSAVGPCGAPV
ncbi:hypothetical protein Nepgr_018016 [Nepenthes gracilis]|uniref:Uncharacterized protein n=1 Tax=Nepenthes gracilis TaxID=150966 RepID=A0AAD3SQI3_NEPGR|nr:hypothetical protein Nepgr_018016 [Nepenthes gracilis]